MKNNLIGTDNIVKHDIQEWFDNVGINYRLNGTDSIVLENCFNINCKGKDKMYIDSKTGSCHCFKCGNRDNIEKHYENYMKTKYIKENLK